MIGIRDVAKYAGVSPSTVSRTLSGVAFVEEETKEKVLKAVKDLNYKPNLAARSLKRGGSKLLGLIIPDMGNPYFSEVVKQIQTRAVRAGYSIILCNTFSEVKQEQESLKSLEYLCVDGIFYISGTDDIRHLEPYVGTVPMVIVNRTYDIDVPCFNTDNIDAAYQAVHYLTNCGHKKISVFMNDKIIQYNHERLAGVDKALKEAGGADYWKYLVRRISSEEDAYLKTLELMKRQDRPTAIFMFTDYMAPGIYLGIARSGLKIPEDISVVGFDDIPMVKYLNPPLTTIQHALVDAWDVIFDKMMEQIQKKECAHGSKTFFKGRLIERESVKIIEE